VAALRDLCLRGGKRLRPALVVAGYRAASCQGDLDTAIDAGVALELLHAYLLIHDDWMDQDSVRRGGPAVHALLARRFRSERVGCAAGILAGDYAAGLAAEALSRLELPPSRAMRIWACFAQMQLDAVAGQQLDLIGRTRSVESVYALKTASYTVRGPLLLGAQLASARTRVLTALDRYSLPVGVAFQLRDDLLGVFGNSSQTGKPTASDLRSGKRTVLLTTGLRRARGRDHRVLKSVVGNAHASQAKLSAAAQVLERCGARKVVEDRIEELLGRARLALRAGRIKPEATALLEGAAQALTDRQG
jgi:geranylgeranyl diphosphate synthase type I